MREAPNCAGDGGFVECDCTQKISPQDCNAGADAKLHEIVAAVLVTSRAGFGEIDRARERRVRTLR